MLINHLVEVTTAEIDAAILATDSKLGRGVAGNYADYKFHVGRVSGFNEAKDILIAAHRSLAEDDDG